MHKLFMRSSLGTNVASPVLNVAHEEFEANAHNERTPSRRGLLSKCDTAPFDVEIDQTAH